MYLILFQFNYLSLIYNGRMICFPILNILYGYKAIFGVSYFIFILWYSYIRLTVRQIQGYIFNLINLWVEWKNYIQSVFLMFRHLGWRESTSRATLYSTFLWWEHEASMLFLK